MTTPIPGLRGLLERDERPGHPVEDRRVEREHQRDLDRQRDLATTIICESHRDVFDLADHVVDLVGADPGPGDDADAGALGPVPVPVDGVAFVLALAAFAAPLLAGGMSALKFVGIV